MKPSADEVKEWLQKANLDLFSAEILLDHDPPVPETAVFHCQQAIENYEPVETIFEANISSEIHPRIYYAANDRANK